MSDNPQWCLNLMGLPIFFFLPVQHLGWALCSSPGERQVNNSGREECLKCVFWGSVGVRTVSPCNHREGGGQEGRSRCPGPVPGCWIFRDDQKSPGDPFSQSPYSHLQCQPRGLKAVKRGGRRGTFPSGTPDFGSGARGTEKRDVAKHARLAAGVRGGGVGRRLEPSSRQKLREPAKWVRTVSGQRQGRWVAACHHVCCPGCCRLLGQMGVMDLGKIPFQNSPGQGPGSSPSLIPLLLMPAPHTPANEAPFNSLTLMRSNHFYPSIRKRL